MSLSSYPGIWLLLLKEGTEKEFLAWNSLTNGEIEILREQFSKTQKM